MTVNEVPDVGEGGELLRLKKPELLTAEGNDEHTGDVLRLFGDGDVLGGSEAVLHQQISVHLHVLA